MTQPPPPAAPTGAPVPQSAPPVVQPGGVQQPYPGWPQSAGGSPYPPAPHSAGQGAVPPGAAPASPWSQPGQPVSGLPSGGAAYPGHPSQAPQPHRGAAPNPWQQPGTPYPASGQPATTPNPAPQQPNPQPGGPWQQPGQPAPGSGQQPGRGGYATPPAQPTPYGQPNPYAQPAQPGTAGAAWTASGQWSPSSAPNPAGPGVTGSGDQISWSTAPSTFSSTPSASGQGRSPKTRLVLMVAGGLVVLIALGFVVARFVRTPVFDQAAMQRDVAEVIKKDFGEGKVTEVSCPSGQKVKLNSTFTCTAKIDGKTKRVTIKVLNEDNAEYEVGQPH